MLLGEYPLVTQSVERDFNGFHDPFRSQLKHVKCEGTVKTHCGISSHGPATMHELPGARITRLF